MFTIWGAKSSRLCDGLSRRDFLKIGALGFGGLTLADLLRLKAQAATSKVGSSTKAVIMVYLPGGPSHIDTYDLKPLAPAEYRGEFKPIRTKIPGLDICELMPRQAQIADKLALLRGLRFAGSHNAYEMLSGFPAARSMEIREKWPVFGAVVSRLRGDQRNPLPAYVNVNDLRMGTDFDDPEVPRYLGRAHGPFRPSGPGFDNLRRPSGFALKRLEDRKALLARFDDIRRDVDASGVMDSLDSFTRRAFAMIASGEVHRALDLSRENPRVVDRYQGATPLLLARRLVEAGVSVVTVAYRPSQPIPEYRGRVINHWDTHSLNFAMLRANLPAYDRAVYTLLTDLYDRGLDKDVAVVIWGEFGRTPKVGDAAPDGRGHWPPAGFAVLAGGGLRMGQVVGETDARAERAKGKPYTPQNVVATLYHVLGIDPALTFPDFQGRPVYLLDDREPIRELL
jgi:hypothetical protein